MPLPKNGIDFHSSEFWLSKDWIHYSRVCIPERVWSEIVPHCLSLGVSPALSYLPEDETVGGPSSEPSKVEMKLLGPQTPEPWSKYIFLLY